MARSYRARRDSSPPRRASFFIERAIMSVKSPCSAYLGWPALAALALLSACASPRTDAFMGVLTPYRVEVVQGNVITREQVEQVKVGMTRAQVRDVLGSPMVSDIFHEDRWDYVFTIRRPGAAPQQRNLVVRFAGERMKSMDAPDLPGEREFVASIDTAKPPKTVPSLALTPEQIKALPTPAVPAGAAAEAEGPSGAVRTYPPLEPR
jgi:outer membrane protein assembly factor BamE